MFSMISGHSQSVRLRVAAVLVGAVTILALASGAFAAGGKHGAPTVSTWSVLLNEVPVSTSGYVLDGAYVGSDQKEYTLVLSLPLTDDARPALAFQTGGGSTTAVVNLLDAAGTILKTYALSEASVVSYHQSGVPGSFDQQLVLKSTALTITP